jgi:acetyl esterase/lipase
VPIGVAPVPAQPRTTTDSNGFDTVDPALAPATSGMPVGPPAGTSAPIQADATLASPFQAASTPAGVTTHRDQAYGERPHARQRFDLHLPAGCSTGGMPLVVWIHGDTWRDGSKADCPITWLANEGYAVASIGYRLSDTAVFPAQLDDCRAAIAEIERNAELWGIDRRRVAVVGSGAGGHLAALVGLVQPAAAPADGDPPQPRIAAVCAVAAPYNLTTLGPAHDRPASPASRLVGGPLPEFREAAQQASPLSHVSADDPPVLIVHGGADTTVPPDQAVGFDAALRAAGVDSTLVMLAGVGHKPSLDRGTPVGLTLLSFLDRVLGPGLRTEQPPKP